MPAFMIIKVIQTDGQKPQNFTIERTRRLSSSVVTLVPQTAGQMPRAFTVGSVRHLSLSVRHMSLSVVLFERGRAGGGGPCRYGPDFPVSRAAAILRRGPRSNHLVRD